MEGGIILKEVKIKSIIERDNELIANAVFFVDKKISEPERSEKLVQINRDEVLEELIDLFPKEFPRFPGFPVPFRPFPY